MSVDIEADAYASTQDYLVSLKAQGPKFGTDRMSFRERLEWLEAATAFAGLLAAAPVVPAPAWARRGREAPPQAIAEKQAAYEAGMPAKDKRAEGTPPTEA